MRDSTRARVTGPLAPYAAGFCEELAGQGYTRASAARQLNLMAHVSRWLASQQLKPEELSAAQVEEFLQARRAAGYTLELSQRGMVPLLVYLRRLGVIPIPAVRVARTDAEQLIEEYRSYLVTERGLAASSVVAYLATARLFLSACEGKAGLDLAGLTAGQVVGFVLDECRRRRPAAAKVLVTGLRSLLRFTFLAGYTPRQLAGAVPHATHGAGSLPRALDAAVVAGLLASCDRRTPAGRRDFAVLTVLARLGLRAGEVATLELDDVDWRQGEIVVRGKGSRTERLPLPVDVGEAIVGYLHDEHLRNCCRALFVRVQAPITGLSRAGVGDVVCRACERAGLPRVGAHRLRHTAATGMLRGGASLTEIGQVLRHAGSNSANTAIYAKVDRVALRSLAQPWPGSAA